MRIATKTVQEFQCEKCLCVYSSEESAKLCESRPVLEDKGVKIGDTVRITSGDGKGARAKVTKIYVIDKDWGHYYADRYWHTVALNADLIGDWGSRTLTFDSYVPEPESPSPNPCNDDIKLGG